MKSHMLRADFFDDPVVKSAESIRIPRLSRARRREQIRRVLSKALAAADAENRMGGQNQLKNAKHKIKLAQLYTIT